MLGYEMFRNLSADNPKKFKKKMLRSFQESLVDPGQLVLSLNDRTKCGRF